MLPLIERHFQAPLWLALMHCCITESESCSRIASTGQFLLRAGPSSYYGIAIVIGCAQRIALESTCFVHFAACCRSCTAGLLSS